MKFKEKLLGKTIGQKLCRFFLLFIIVVFFTHNLKNDKQIFLYSIKTGNLKKLDKMLRKHPEYVNSRDKYGVAPLNYAIEFSNEEIAVKLINSGAEINYYVSSENIYNSMENFDKQPAEKIIEWATSQIKRIRGYYPICGGMIIINQTFEQKSPLDMAIYNNQRKTVQALLRKGAKFSPEEMRCFTPLGLAGMCRNKQIVRVLIDYINEKEKRDGKWSARYLYSLHGHFRAFLIIYDSQNVANLLLDYGYSSKEILLNIELAKYLDKQEAIKNYMLLFNKLETETFTYKDKERLLEMIKYIDEAEIKNLIREKLDKLNIISPEV